MKGARRRRDEVEERGGGRGVEYEAGLSDGGVGADDRQDVVLITASAAPRREAAVKDILLTALALNRLKDKMRRQIGGLTKEGG